MKRDLQASYISRKRPGMQRGETRRVSETAAHVRYLMQRDSRGATRESAPAIATGFLPRVDGFAGGATRRRDR